jgi:hypothetical protein
MQVEDFHDFVSEKWTSNVKSPGPSLPAAPTSIVDAQGRLLQGRFTGAAADIDWARLTGALTHNAMWRYLHHKRWIYVALASGDFFCAMAIVDIGWASMGFAYAFDLRTSQVVAGFSKDSLPGFGAKLAQRCGDGATHHFARGLHRIDIEHVPARHCYKLQLRSPGFEISAEFAESGALLLAVGQVARGAAHATQKSSVLPMEGELRVSGECHNLKGATASFDYSNGLLARHTAWQWASAHELGTGFNLQSGYFGDHENALWLDNEIFPLGRAVFEFDQLNPMACWHVGTCDGLVDLNFFPKGLRRENKNVVLASSRYVQPIGLFHGVVQATQDSKKRTVKGMVGVTEDHQSRW